MITVNVDPGAPCGDLFAALLSVAPELAGVLQELLAVDGVFLQDELGQVWDKFTARPCSLTMGSCAPRPQGVTPAWCCRRYHLHHDSSSCNSTAR